MFGLTLRKPLSRPTPQPALELDFLCAAAKLPFVVELVEVGPGYLIQRMRTPASFVASPACQAGDANSSLWDNAPATRNELALNRVSFTGASCPHCSTSLDGFTICTNCHALVCHSAWKSYPAPDQTMHWWFSCPCGKEGWAGNVAPLTTVLARKCDDPSREARTAPAPKALPEPSHDLLRLPAPKSGR